MSVLVFLVDQLHPHPRAGNDPQQFHQPPAPPVPGLCVPTLGGLSGHHLRTFLSVRHSVGRNLEVEQSQGTHFLGGESDGFMI